jgi:hypothetical protein
MSPTIIEDLHRTVIGRWHTRLAANPSARRNHWHTKIVYFRAVEGLLSAPPALPLTWKDVVEAARPRGCRSTFYEVAGARARHRMVDDLIADGSPDAMLIALLYLRADPVAQLIDETKVWSFAPYRERLLEQELTAAQSPEQTADALAYALTAWAWNNGPLAAALGGSPPASAVEDLTVICRGRLAAGRAADRLGDVLRAAAGAAGGEPLAAA